MAFEDTCGTYVLAVASIECGGTISYVVATVCGSGSFRTAGVLGTSTDVCVCISIVGVCSPCEGEETITDGILGEASVGVVVTSELVSDDVPN